MWFPQINNAFWDWLEKVKARLTYERERWIFPPSLTSSICDQTMYLKKWQFQGLPSLANPFPDLHLPFHENHRLQSRRAGPKTLLVLGLHHPCAQNVRLDKCTSLFGPKRGQKKRRLFLTICFFYTVNFVSFACCDFNCLKRQKKGVKKAHLIRNNVFVMWTILPNMRACVCFNLCARLGAWLCDFIWALDQL